MFHLFCDVGFVRSLVEVVAATAKFLDAVVLETQFHVWTQTEIRAEAKRLVLQFGQFRIPIAIIVEALSVSGLSVGIDASLVVVGN